MKRIHRNIHPIQARAASFLRSYGGRIAYYCGVFAVLCAIAYAAEIYRNADDDAADDLILPAVETLEAAETLHQNQPALILPEGTVCIRSFSAAPQWNQDLLLWEAHPASDFTFADGIVRSLSAGTVLTVGESGMLGGFVEMQCGDLMLRYASIEPDAALQPGMELAAGDTIGTVSDSMPSEAVQQKHLHLEVLRNEMPLDLASLCENTAAGD